MRFVIRDILWLTLVVALCISWYCREEKHREEMKALAGHQLGMGYKSLFKVVDERGLDKVHSIRMIYHRWYSPYSEIVWHDRSGLTRVQIAPDGSVKSSDTK